MARSAEATQHVCARCAQTSSTCCTLTPGQEELCFPLSASERAAMQAAGATAAHFASQANTEAFVDNLCRLFPGEGAHITALFPPGGAHDRLAVSQTGACLLLGPQGCALPRHARPLYCLLFPFWIRSGRQLYFEFTTCQAQRDAQAGAGLLGRLGMTAESVRHLYSELRKAWGLPEPT